MAAAGGGQDGMAPRQVKTPTDELIELIAKNRDTADDTIIRDVRRLLAAGASVLTPHSTRGDVCAVYGAILREDGVSVHTNRRGELRQADNNRVSRVTRDIINHIPDGRVNDQLNTYRGQTAMHVAMSRGAVGTVRLLLELGARIDVLDNQGDNPIGAAIGLYSFHARGVDLCEIALEAGYVPTFTDFMKLMRCGVTNVELTQWFIDHDADIVPDALVGSPVHHPLHWTSASSSADLAVLKAIAASPNFRRGLISGVTTFVYATNMLWNATADQVRLVDWLLSAGYSPLERCSDGRDYFALNAHLLGGNHAYSNVYIRAVMWRDGVHPIQIETARVRDAMQSVLPSVLADMVADFCSMSPARAALVKRMDEQ